MGYIRVAADRWHFEDASTGDFFVPNGVNYCSYIAYDNTFPGLKSVAFPLFGTDAYTESDPIQEARRAMARLAEIGVNVIRVWLEPHDFFPVGLRLDPHGADLLDGLLDAARSHGIRVSLNPHLCPNTAAGFTAGIIRTFEPNFRERYNEQLYLLADRWGNDETIFSWSLVGEGRLPWETPYLRKLWPDWLRYWYDNDIQLLREAWPGVRVDSFDEAPIPPRNIGAMLPLDACTPGNLDKFPGDPFANSTWRYDWRLLMEDVGAAWVGEQVRVLRQADVKQMVTVGNNSWIFPGLAAGLMATGFNPYFYLDHVDYTCQHNYPAPQCLAGGNGDPMSSEEAMQFWLNACEVMGRVYGSLGKPVVLEEWGWYGGRESSFLVDLPFRSEEDQAYYNERMMEMVARTYSGQFYWQWRDMPMALDISNGSGLYACDGHRAKPAGENFKKWADRFAATPPQRAAARTTIDLDIKALYTSDVAHETWWQEICRNYPQIGPVDFNHVFEKKPIMTRTYEYEAHLSAVSRDRCAAK